MAISSNELHKSNAEVSTQQQRPLLTFTNVSEITTPTLVYERKKLSQPSIIPNVSEIAAPMHVYERRKHPARSASTDVSDITAPMHVYKRRKLYQPSMGGTDVSDIRAPMRFYKRRKLSNPSTSSNVCENTASMLVYKRRKLSRRSTMLVYNRRKLKRGKNSSRMSLSHSVNDSCSCSRTRSDVELNSGSMSKEVEDDDTAECSSSSASERDICIEILVRHGVIKEFWPRRRGSSAGIRIGGTGCRRCRVCSRSDSTKRMLLCDDCEDAFHMSCITPRISVVPVDEWFCYPCLKKKKKPKVWKDASEWANTIDSVSGSLGGASASGPSPIDLMLVDGEPYASHVRIGKRFQAEVPDWSGPAL